METNAPFSKAEMLQQLRSAILMYIRSTSWVLDSDAATRLMGWPQDGGTGALCSPDIFDADEVERLDGQSFNFPGYKVYRTFDQLYDYGVLGFVPERSGVMEGADDDSFAISFAFDFDRSDLIREMHNGETESVSHCIQTANLAIARAILDGGERLPVGPRGLPDDLLTISEVALLANMEERSVRNLASGKRKPDSLMTTTRDGTRYVSREDAREWLAGRKGYTPTKQHGPLAELDLSTRGFEDSQQVIDYLIQRSAVVGVSYWDFATSDTGALGEIEPAVLAADAERCALIAERLRVDKDLLQLRIQEAITAEQLAKLRKAIQQTKRRAP